MANKKYNKRKGKKWSIKQNSACNIVAVMKQKASP